MPITERVDQVAGMVYTTITGSIVAAEVLAHIERERLGHGLSYPEFIDARGFYPDFNGDHVRMIVERLRAHSQRTALGPTAVLVDSDVGYGMLRMLEMMLDDVASVRPFRDADEATTWLRETGSPGVLP